MGTEFVNKRKRKSSKQRRGEGWGRGERDNREGGRGREKDRVKERKQEKGGRGNEAQGRNKLTTAIQPKRWIQAGMTGQCADQPITYEPPPDQVFVLFVCRVKSL